MNKIPFLLVLVFTFLFLPNLNLLSGEKGHNAEQQENQDYSVTVRLKLIQVYVTDKDGNPVQNLARSDFVLYDNGKRKEITDFEKHIMINKEMKTEEKTSPEISSGMNRKFLILLDIAGNDSVGVIQSKETALHFVDTQLMPGDEVGVLSFTPYAGFNINTYFTSDHDKIKHAIKSAKEVPETKWEGPSLEQLKAAGEAEAMAKQSSSGQGTRGGGSGLGFQGESSTTSMFVRPFSEPKRSKKGTMSLIMTVSELAKTLKYIPGIKHILFFSGGGHQKFHGYFERLGMELAGANCLVHTINAMGTRSHFQGWNRPSKETLEILSSASGGKYYEDVSDYEAISADIQNLSSNYYVLGYYIDEKWDGRYHKIQVDLKQEDCLVFAQGGYFNPKPFSQFSEFEKKLHLIDLALSDKPYFQDPVDVPLTILPCSNTSKSNCVLLSELSVNRIEGNPGQKIEIINIILDEKKKIIDSCRGEIEYSELKESRSYQYTILSLPPGQYECRVALRNLSTGKGAFGLSSVTILPKQKFGLALFSPLLLIPDNDSRFLKLSLEKEKTKDGDDLSLNQIYPFLSNRHSLLILQLEKRSTQILAVLRWTAIQIQQPEIELFGALIDESTGEKAPLNFNVTSSRKLDDTDVLLIDILLPELPSGQYSIEFSAKENVTDSRSVVARSFVIK